MKNNSSSSRSVWGVFILLLFTFLFLSSCSLFQENGEGNIQGTAIYENGQPAVGITVELKRYNLWNGYISYHWVADTNTDSSGFYSFKNVEHDGYRNEDKIFCLWGQNETEDGKILCGGRRIHLEYNEVVIADTIALFPEDSLGAVSNCGWCYDYEF